MTLCKLGLHNYKFSRDGDEDERNTCLDCGDKRETYAERAKRREDLVGIDGTMV